MRVVLLIKSVTKNGACPNLHKTNPKASVIRYSSMCVVSRQFNFALSEILCLDISIFCYSDSLVQVFAFPSTPCCGGAGCGPDAALLAWFGLWHIRGRWWGASWDKPRCSTGHSAPATELPAQVWLPCWELVCCLSSVLPRKARKNRDRPPFPFHPHEGALLLCREDERRLTHRAWWWRCAVPRRLSCPSPMI